MGLWESSSWPKKFIWVFPVVFFSFSCSAKNLREEGKFSYRNLYKERYEKESGGLIPLTLERGESLSGSISPDGKYLYFASNRLGNYDLFLRPLDDVEIIPITKKVTNQTEPVISPNGKWLAYIDDELDPDGDLVILKIDPESYLKSYEKGEDPQAGIFTSQPKVLTNDEKNRVRSRESNPTWSPDSKWIAFSSDMTSPQGNPFGPGFGAIQNLWLMDPEKPMEARKLTEKGGVMPSFSPDGKKIAYVSYEIPNSNGDIFELDLTTNLIRQLTFGDALDLSPSYSQDGKFLIFTRIAKDTNGDGVVNRKDQGQLLALPLEEKSATPFALTLSQHYVFGNRSSHFIGGSLVFSFSSGENINLAFIPETGILPKKLTSYEQYEFSKTLKDEKNPENKELYLLSLNQLIHYFSEDPQKPIYAARGLFDGYLYCRNHCPDEALKFAQKIKKEAPQNPFLQYYLGLLRLRLKENFLVDIPSPIIASSPLDYLRQFATDLEKERQLSFPQQETQKAFQGEVFYDLFQEEKASGNLIRSHELKRQIVENFPNHIRTKELLEKEAQEGLGQNLPKALLFFLYPEKHPYFADKERNELLQKNISEKTKVQMYDLVYSHFVNLLKAGKKEILKELIALYPEKSYPEIYALYGLAQAEFALEGGDLALAKKELPEEKNLPKFGKFRYLYKRIQGEISELENNESEAFSYYYEAFLNYDPSYKIPKTRNLLARSLEYYENLAKRHRQEGRFTEAFSAYERLVKLQLVLQALKIEKDLVEKNSLEILIQLNELTFSDPTEKNKLFQKINKFYEDNIDFARKYLVNSFIFGKAHLKAQVGMLRHMAYEKEGLSSSKKKEVLKLFKEAEKDFRWSFFADPLFPESYVMLGWMYQFIDTRREMIVEPAENTKDKEKFADLYPRFFPNYLFEEGIRLYQKSIDFFKDKTNPQILVSFHLNMGNNYFLLSNYAKAEENYEIVLKAIENNDYQFENEIQKALFYYHLGRSYYYTGKYRKAALALRKSLEIYDKLAPIDGVPLTQQKENRRKREMIMRQLALNADLNNEPQEAKKWYETILQEQQRTGEKEDQSFLFLELARLYLEEQNFELSLFYLRQAEERLKNEREIKPPKYKIRIKWLGFYEPWTTILSWIYELPYDQVYVGENRLAFPIPTVNRYQYLYSMEAELYRQKGLYSEAKDALLKLQEYAKKDKSKHGKETLLRSYMRLGEIYYRLNDFAQARDNYQKAKKLAQDLEDFLTLQKAEKNLLIIAAKELEFYDIPEKDKMKIAEKELKDIEKFISQYSDKRVKKEEEKLKAKNKALRLTEEQKAKIKLEALQEIYKIAVFQGVFHFYLAEILEGQVGLKEGAPLTLDEWLKLREKSRDHFLKAEHFFRGMVVDPLDPEKEVYFVEKKDQGMRLALNFNKARLYQVFGLRERAFQEYQLAYQRAEEFRSDRFLALAAYRLTELSGNPEFAEKAYQIFTEQSYLITENPTLFEKVSEVRLKSLLAKRDYPSIIRTEDLKRFLLARDYYFRKLKFFDPELQEKYEKYLLLTTMEANRRKLIESLRLWRENTEVWEKELEKIQEDRKATEIAMITGRSSGQLAPLFYRVDPFEEQSLPLLYLIDIEDKTLFIVVSLNKVVRKKNLVNELTFEHQVFSISSNEIEEIRKKLLTNTNLEKTPDWLSYLKTVFPQQIVTSTRFYYFPFDLLYEKKPSFSLNLPMARLFSRNQNVSRNRLLQITAEGTLFGGGNKVTYDFSDSFQTVDSLTLWKKHSAGYSVLDYEANLVGENEAIEQNKLPFYQISETFMFPSLVLVHYQKSPNLSPKALFNYQSAITLLSASRGATGVLHFQENRKANLNKTKDALKGRVGHETILYGFSPMREFLLSGKKSESFLKLADLERQREISRLREKEEDLAQVEMRFLRAKDSEELLSQASLESFLESRELFSLKNQLLLEKGEVAKAILEWKNREKKLQSQNKMKELVEEKSQMVSRLFVNGFKTEAEKEMEELINAFTSNEWLSIFEGFHLSALVQGKPQVFNQALPDPYERARVKFNINLPQGLVERMGLFLNSSSHGKNWENLLVENFEYQALREYYRKNPPPKENPVLRYYLIKKTYDKNFSPETALDFFNRLEKGEVNSKLIYSASKEAYAEKFINFHYLWEKGKISEALLLGENYLNEAHFPKEGKDAIFITLVWDLWKRLLKPNEELAIITFLKKEAEKIAKMEKNPQRKFFYTLLSLVSELRDGITPLEEILRKGLVDEPSSVNKSLVNRLAYYSLTYRTQKAGLFAYFPQKDYIEDEEIIRRFQFLAKLRGENLVNFATIKETWQIALSISYLREINQNEKALVAYLSYDRGISSLPKLKYPLLGVVSFYPDIYGLFTLKEGRVSWEDVQIKNPKDFDKITQRENAFYFYEPQFNNLREKNNWQLKKGMMLFASAEDLPYKERFGYTTKNPNHTISSLLRLYYPKESKSPFIDFSTTWQESSGIINFSEEKDLPKKASGGYYLVASRGKESPYLRFTEIFLQQLQKNVSIEEAFLTSQKELLTIYPLPQDYLSVRLVRF